MHVHWLIFFLQQREKNLTHFVTLLILILSRKKKAFSNKGRSKLITVVCLDNDSHKVPRGSLRERLKGNGRIKDIPFFRYLTCEETRSSIEQAFSLSNGFTFLKSLKNVLCVAEKQELNGAELISLAGKGSLYVTMKFIISTDTAHSADSVRIYLIPPSMTDSSLTSISSSHSQSLMQRRVIHSFLFLLAAQISPLVHIAVTQDQRSCKKQMTYWKNYR